jgi:hypothetical protein
MGRKSIRQARKEKRKQEQRRTRLIVGVVAIGVLAVIGLLVWNVVRPAAGESVEIMANAGDHVPEGEDPGPFNSDPMTSGPHYPNEYDAGFYDENSPEAQVDYPEGYLGHNLEHGYIIYWYNCDLLDGAACTDLKAQIRESMDDNGSTKLIAFPWDSIDVPVVLTSWGQMMRMEEFDPGQASRFVSANRNRAPEPNAP